MRTSWLARAEAQLPQTTDWLSENERRYASGMRYTKRRMDFLLNRWTLKLAVASALGLSDAPSSLARIEARPAPDGAPEVFLDNARAPFGVSLTDRAGCAVCLVADGAAAIGCDLELVEPRSPAFVRDYLTGPEVGAVSSAGPARDLAVNLIWSAKESALKVLRTGLRRDTRSVEVTVADLAAPEWSWSPLEVRAAEGAVFAGWWRRTGSFLLTACAATSIPPPSGLDEVSPLDSASPTHRWLSRPLG